MSDLFPGHRPHGNGIAYHLLDPGGGAMGFWEVTVDALTLKPRIRRTGGGLIIEPGFLTQALTLFAFKRRVEVDAVRRQIRIDEKFLWFRTDPRQIPFDRIAYIDYGYTEAPTDFSWQGTTDQVERFTISVVIKDSEEKVRLTRYSGAGSRSTGWRGVTLGDDELVDFRGRQEEASRDLVSELRELLGVPIGRPVVHVANESGRYLYCTACERPSPPKRKRCQYCGGVLSVKDPGSPEE